MGLHLSSYNLQYRNSGNLSRWGVSTRICTYIMKKSPSNPNSIQKLSYERHT